VGPAGPQTMPLRIDNHRVEETYKDVAESERMLWILSTLFSEHYDS